MSKGLSSNRVLVSQEEISMIFGDEKNLNSKSNTGVFSAQNDTPQKT